MRRAPVLVLAGCLSIVLAWLPALRESAAAFTAATEIPANAFTIDRLANYFGVVPGAAVRAGSSIPVAVGDVDSLSLDFGLVPSARSFTGVFTVTNLSGGTQTATLTLAGLPQIASAVFAASGSGSVVLAPGASTSVTITTSASVAGRGSGTVRLGLGGASWLYRAYPLMLDEAPEAPTGLVASPRSAGRIALSWSASSTTTGLGGYDVYRSNGAGYAKLNASPVAATQLDDVATADGVGYTYLVRAVSTGSPLLTSLDSGVAAATADATAPSQPTSVALGNGGGTGGTYVNAANAGGLVVTVTMPAGSLASDWVAVTATDGAASVTGAAAASAGAGAVSVTLNVSGLAEGTLAIRTTATDAAGNVSSPASLAAPKDTVAPGAPAAAYQDNKNVADGITGTAAPNATVRATQTAPSASGPYATTASSSGAYTLTVAVAKNVTVTYSVTATDAAGNTGPATTLTFATVR